MPVLDHFHAPLHPRHPWESFHGSWCNAMMGQPLPLVPLGLRGAGIVPLDLEQSYKGAREDSGL